MDVETLEKELAPIKELRVEKISDAAVVEIAPTESQLYLHDGEYQYVATEDSYKTSLKHIGMSSAMVSKLSATTASAAATELLQKKGEATAVFKDQILMAMAPKGRYKPFSVAMALDIIQSELGEFEVNRASMRGQYTVRLEIAGPDQFQVEDDDLIRAGVMVDFNPIGLTDPIVQTFGVRLVCTNGATSNVVFSTQALTSEEEDNKEWFRANVRAAYDGVEAAVEQWRNMQKKKVTARERPLLLGGFARAAGLNGKEQSALFAHAAENPPQNAYDVFNCLTWLTSHGMDDPNRTARAQLATAKFVGEETHSKHCPTCKRAGA